MRILNYFFTPVLVISLLSWPAFANKIVVAPNSPDIVEADFLSVDIRADGMGSVVARPCDEGSDCKTIYALINVKTRLMLNGKEISLQQARRGSWESGVLAYDEHDNAIWVDFNP